MSQINIIDFYVNDGFRISSDPRYYASGIFGLRNYTVNGHNYDSWCNGKHEAVDLSKRDGAPIKTFEDGEIVAGTGFGGFGYQVCVAYPSLGIQVIFGHVKPNIPVKIGQKVKKGQVIAYQGNTHNQGPNVSMASHLHLQVQELGYIADEWTFICTGINPFNIKINDKKGKDNPSAPKETDGTHVVKANDTLWGIAQAHNTTVDKIKSDNKLKNDIIHIDQKLKVGKGKAPEKKSFNKMANRKLSNTAYFKGKVDKLGAEVRNKSGNNFNKKAGYDLQQESTVFIFQVVGGWGKIYTSRTSGNGSNDWIWLERLNVTQVF